MLTGLVVIKHEVCAPAQFSGGAGHSFDNSLNCITLYYEEFVTHFGSKDMATTVPFSMRMEQGLYEELKEEAEIRDRPASYLVSRAVKEFLRREKEERAILLERLNEADAGVFVSEERVTEWVNSWFTGDELPQPTPDILPTNE